MIVDTKRTHHNNRLYEATGGASYAEAITAHMDNWIKVCCRTHTRPQSCTHSITTYPQIHRTKPQPPQTVPRTPKGLSYFNDWAANRFAANAAFTALVAADLGLNPAWYRQYGAQQIHYMLGDCCNGEMSHLVGFGPKWPTSVHHRGSSCKDSDPESCSCTGLPNSHQLYGALIGGPTRDDQISPEGCADFIKNEVATDYNAGFTSALAGLKHLSVKGELPKA